MNNKSKYDNKAPITDLKSNWAGGKAPIGGKTKAPKRGETRFVSRLNNSVANRFGDMKP